jgi:hypothetical protein
MVPEEDKGRLVFLPEAGISRCERMAEDDPEGEEYIQNLEKMQSASRSLPPHFRLTPLLTKTLNTTAHTPRLTNRT